MNILVNVISQKMILSSCTHQLVAGSQQFVKFRFNLDEDWDDLVTFAQFQQGENAYNQYLDEENCVYLPTEIGAGICKLVLYGSNGTTIGTTNYLTFKVSDNILVSDVQSTDISESLYAQLVQKVESLIAYQELWLQGEHGIGQLTEAGGLIFNDYDTNKATAKHATAFGTESVAAGVGSFANGDKIDRSGAPDVGSEDFQESDWRRNEAVGTGAVAWGQGTVAYSRASKSLGYRTQTGYPPSAEEAAKRPEAITLTTETAVALDSAEVTVSEGSSVTFEENKVTAKLYISAEYTENGDPITVPATAELSYPVANCKKLRLSFDASGFDQAWWFGAKFTLLFRLNDGSEIVEHAFTTDYSDMTEDSYTHELYDNEITVPDDASAFVIRMITQEPGDEAWLYVYMEDMTLAAIETTYPEDNNGQSAVAIGSDTAAVGNNSLVGGYRAIASGAGAFAFGSGVEASGDRAIALGGTEARSPKDAEAIWTKATKWGSIAIGSGSESNGVRSIALGHQVKTNKENQIAIGRYNADDSNALLIVGNGTSDTVRRNALTIDANNNLNVNTTQVKVNNARLNLQGSGAENTIYSEANLTIGSGNAVTGSAHNIVCGMNNTHKSMMGMTVGYGNSNLQSNRGYVIGVGINLEDNENPNGTPRFVFGSYNDTVASDDLFVVANGTWGARSNAMVVRQDGTVKVGGTLSIEDGVNDTDAVTVGQLNAAVGDIETALDSILEIQNSLIGGESA